MNQCFSLSLSLLFSLQKKKSINKKETYPENSCIYGITI